MAKSKHKLIWVSHGKKRYLYDHQKDKFYYEYQNKGVIRIDFEDMNEEAREKAGDYFTSEAFKQTR